VKKETHPFLTSVNNVPVKRLAHSNGSNTEKFASSRPAFQGHSRSLEPKIIETRSNIAQISTAVETALATFIARDAHHIAWGWTLLLGPAYFPRAFRPDGNHFWWWDNNYFFYRSTLCVNVVFAVARCLSVCSSVHLAVRHVRYASSGCQTVLHPDGWRYRQTSFSAR